MAGAPQAGTVHGPARDKAAAATIASLPPRTTLVKPKSSYRAPPGAAARLAARNSVTNHNFTPGPVVVE
eukprot:1005722-Prymnesium_polylepis.1